MDGAVLYASHVSCLLTTSTQTDLKSITVTATFGILSRSNQFLLKTCAYGGKNVNVLPVQAKKLLYLET